MSFCPPCRHVLERIATRCPGLWRWRRVGLAMLATYLFFTWLGSLARPVVGAGFCRVFY